MSEEDYVVILLLYTIREVAISQKIGQETFLTSILKIKVSAGLSSTST
jgi:hypothetical protein